MGAANPNLCSRKSHRLTATWGFVGHTNEALSLNAPRIRNFCHFSGIRFTPGPFDRWRSSADSNRLAAIKKPLLGARIRSIAHKRLIGNNGKRLECGLNKARHGIQRFASFRTLSRSAHRFVPRMFSKTAIIGLLGTQPVGERRWERCLQNAKSAHRNRAPFGVCLLKRQPWPRSRATTATLAATEHMAMQNTAARNRNARGKSNSSRKEPRGAPSFLPSTFIRAAESKGLMSPKEATPHSKRPLSAKDGTRFAQNMKKACRTRHAHAAESAPHDAQTRIGV